MKLVKDIYLITKEFPKAEQFGLTSQIQRAAVSIPANIAEGSAKSSNKDFGRFLEISIGSICELETLIIIAKDLEYININNYDSLDLKIKEIQRMLIGFKSQLSI
jgi:S23 ribosomal protein.